MTLAAVMTLLGTFKDAIGGPWYWLFAMRGLPQYFESRPFLSPICLAICLALACLSPGYFNSFHGLARNQPPRYDMALFGRWPRLNKRRTNLRMAQPLITPPNKPAAPSPAMASWLHSAHHRRGFGEPDR